MGDNVREILLAIFIHLLKELLKVALNLLEDGDDVAPPPSDL